MTTGGRDAEATTRRLREAAIEELLAVGQADLAMESVARRGYYSVGAVYGRWPDRECLLVDVARSTVAPALSAALRAAAKPADAIAWVLEDGRDQVLVAGEILLAGHTMPQVRPASLETWRALREGLAGHLAESMAWYVATYALGNALLHAIGLDGPQSGRTSWLVDAAADAAAVRVPVTGMPEPDSIDIPVVPGPEGTDEVASALIGAARLLLAEQGAAGTSTRGIAASAGVTTGALYRRYQGKSRLLADVLLTQLQPDRYTWTWDLVQSLASADPYEEAADVIAQRLIAVSEDAPAQEVLLQVGIAARSDPVLRERIAERVQIAHASRTEMVRHFADTGMLRDDVSPGVFAWGFQTIPVGVRATLPLGVPLDRGAVGASMAALLRAAGTSPDP